MGQFISEIDTRFAPYAEEVRACANSRGVPYGTPADLVVFVQQIAVPGRLRSEISSLVRATIFREQEEINPETIVELLSLAVGGPEGMSSRPELARARHELQGFVSEVFRGLWTRFPEAVNAEVPEIGLDAPERPRSFGAISGAEDIRLSPAPHPEPEAFAAQGRPPQPAPAAPPVQQTQRAIPHLYLDLQGMTEAAEAPAQAHAAFDPAPEPEPQAVSVAAGSEPAWELYQDAPTRSTGLFGSLRSLWRDPEPEVTEEGEYPQYSSLSLSEPERRRYLLLGAGGLLFGAALGTWLWHTPAAPQTSGGPAPAVRSSVPESATPAEQPAARPPLPDTTTTPPAGFAGDVAQTATASPYPRSARAVTNRDWDRALASTSNAQPGNYPPERATAPETRRAPALPASLVPRSAPRPPAPAPSGQPPPAPATPAPVPSLAGGSSPRTVVNGGSVYLSVAGPMAANLLSAPVPQYPAAARAAGVQGEVTVQAVIGLGGDVVATRVLSGPAPLRDAAQSAVHRWRFIPYLVGGRPSMFTTEAVVDFRGTRDGVSR